MAHCGLVATISLLVPLPSTADVLCPAYLLIFLITADPRYLLRLDVCCILALLKRPCTVAVGALKTGSLWPVDLLGE